MPFFGKTIAMMEVINTIAATTSYLIILLKLKKSLSPTMVSILSQCSFVVKN